jgi:phosphatidylinositol alpha-1,6-mannosyltransferase
MSRRTLVVTNDFPPRSGGIESYVVGLVSRLNPADVVVYARGQQGDAAYDADLPYPVVRHPRGIMVAEPTVARRAAELVRSHGCTSVWFGAAAPLALTAPAVRRAGARTVVASTHGHELWWARVPGARRALRRIGDACDTVTYLGPYTRARISPALSPAARSRLVQLPPGVDDALFRPDAAARTALRAELGLGDRPVVLCVSRLVERKGQDTLLRALPAVRAEVPETTLLVVGRGPDLARLQSLAARLGLAGAVVFADDVPTDRLPAYYAAADVFAMPCRSRRGGLEVEGLGIVYLEASASGLPVVAGDSGGAPDAVLQGETGYVVDGRSAQQVAERVTRLLRDPVLAARMGQRGRSWVAQRWRWDALAARLDTLLARP